MSKISWLVILLMSASCAEPQEETGVATPTQAEGLAYRVAAELAKRGVSAYFNGVELDGLTMRMKRGTLLSKFGVVDARDIEVGLSVAPGPMWGTFVPAISLHAKEARVIGKRPRGGQAPEERVASGQTDWLHKLARLTGIALQARVGALRVRGVAGTAQARATAYPFSGKREVVAGVLNKDVDLIARLRDEGDAITGRVMAKRVAVPALTRGLRKMGRQAKLITGGYAYGVAEFAYERVGSLALKVAAQVRDVCVEQRRFGEGKACGVSFGGAARIGATREQVFVEASTMRFGKATLRAEGLLPLKGDDSVYDFTLHVPRQPIQPMLDAIPKQWRTGLIGFELDGTLQADLSIRGSGDEVEIEPEFSFRKVRVTKAPAGQDPRRLAGPITWTLPFPYTHTVSFAPDAGFAPLSSVPQLLVDAVRISEDAAFWQHDGFDRDQIAKALADLRGGAGARGASTISQQLAKNLYFDGERNLTRKVEEAIATAALESSLTKHRLMEIYLNIIEWGDGVFGVARASRHYFDKAPYELTEKEIAFLAGIIPAPRKADREMRVLGASAWAEKRTQRVTRFLCDVGKFPSDQCSWESAAGDDSVLTTAKE